MDPIYKTEWKLNPLSHQTKPKTFLFPEILIILSQKQSHRRYTDTASNRVVNQPTVRIQEPQTNGVNAAEVADALTSGGKGKKNTRRIGGLTQLTPYGLVGTQKNSLSFLMIP